MIDLERVHEQADVWVLECLNHFNYRVNSTDCARHDDLVDLAHIVLVQVSVVCKIESVFVVVSDLHGECVWTSRVGKLQGWSIARARV